MNIAFYDWWLYRLFHWRWNKILARHPIMREVLISHLKAFDVLDVGEKVKISVVIEKEVANDS